MGFAPAHLRVSDATYGLCSHFSYYVYRARKTFVSSLPTALTVLRENPYATPSCLANHLVHHSPVLTELIITREWLQDTAPSPQIVESAAAYWNFTRLGLMHAQRAGAASTPANLVKELDPDVVTRDPGGVLAAEDTVGGCANHTNISCPDDVAQGV